ncbi:MAG TPA: tetratricopeptide repeat protein [Tepidisphaeraceae bacterium]|nr:tetratricopeptide repeat protein [Tepidisphaeraceae bacterium]
MSKTSSRWPAVVVALVALVVMGRLCAMDFTWWDDNETIHHNPLLNPATWGTIGHYWTHAYMGLYVPVTYMVWTGLAAIARLPSPDDYGIALNPWVFHSANVLVHLVNALIVYLILHRVVKRDWAAAAGAMVFAVHPVQVEAVAWVSGMKDLLCGMFVLLAVWQYLGFAESRHRGRYIGALICTAVATLCKPTAVVTPVLLAVLDRWVVGRSWREVGRGVWAFVLVVLPCVVWSKWVQQVGPRGPMWGRPIVAMDALAFYFWKLVWPGKLAVDYGRNPAYVLSQWWWRVTCMVPVVVGIVVWRGKWRLSWAGAGVFVGGLLPVLGLTPFMFQAFSTTADHYLYLPMLGVALVVAGVVARWPTRGVGMAMGVVVGVLAIRSVVQAGYWEDDQTLDRHTLAVNPQSGVAHVNLAAALEYQFKLTGKEAFRDQAVEHLRTAISLNVNATLARENLATILIERGEIDEAIQLLIEGLAMADQLPDVERGNHAAPHYVLAAVLAKRGRYAEAAVQYRAALKDQPGNVQIQRDLAAVERKSTTTRASS